MDTTTRTQDLWGKAMDRASRRFTAYLAAPVNTPASKKAHRLYRQARALADRLDTF